MTNHEARAALDIVTGMLSIFGIEAYVLIDLGSSYSYISTALVTRLGLKLDIL